MYISHISDSLSICWLCMNLWQMWCFLNHRLWWSQMEFYKRLFLFKCFGAAKEFSQKPIWIRIVFQTTLNKIHRKYSICSWILTQNLSLFFCLIMYIILLLFRSPLKIVRIEECSELKQMKKKILKHQNVSVELWEYYTFCYQKSCHCYSSSKKKCAW